MYRLAQSRFRLRLKGYIYQNKVFASHRHIQKQFHLLQENFIQAKLFQAKMKINNFKFISLKETKTK